jgi:hypothetical protein
MSHKQSAKKKSKIQKFKKKQKVTFNDVEDDVLKVLNKALKEKKDK